jgi:hypothetical protein
MKANYSKGSKFYLTPDAVENYGEEYRNRVFTVAEWFDHRGRDQHGHPGFDEAAGSCLYGIEELSFSLYEWEMTTAAQKPANKA